MIVVIRDASLKTGDKAVGGVILFLTNSSMTRASPIYWKAKQIDRVCHSSKDAETLNLLTMAEDSVYAANQLEQMLYGDILRRIPICLFTDSESILEDTSINEVKAHGQEVRMTNIQIRIRPGV